MPPATLRQTARTSAYAPRAPVRQATGSAQAGSEKTGLSLWNLPPGETAYPYHWHLAEEELIVVDGRTMVGDGKGNGFIGNFKPPSKYRGNFIMSPPSGGVAPRPAAVRPGVRM